MTTSHPTLLAALALLFLASGCAEPIGANGAAVGKSGGSSSLGGGTSTSTATSGGTSGTTTTATGSGGTSGATTATTGSGGTTGTTTTTTGSGGTTTTTTTGSGGATTTTTTPSSCGTTTDVVTIKHDPQLGSTLIGGTTTITPALASAGAAAPDPFDASKLVLKFCFSVLGPTAPTVSATDITLYDAAIQASAYLSLRTTILKVETSTEGRSCLVFDVGTVSGSAGMMMSGTNTIVYNWRWESKNLGTGNMLDPTAGKEPSLLVTIDGALAACMTVAKY